MHPWGKSAGTLSKHPKDSRHKWDKNTKSQYTKLVLSRKRTWKWQQRTNWLCIDEASMQTQEEVRVWRTNYATNIQKVDTHKWELLWACCWQLPYRTWWEITNIGNLQVLTRHSQADFSQECKPFGIAQKSQARMCRVLCSALNHCRAHKSFCASFIGVLVFVVALALWVVSRCSEANASQTSYCPAKTCTGRRGLVPTPSLSILGGAQM